MPNVFVWVDQFGGRALPVSWEAIGVARSLAADGQVTALVFGSGVGNVITLALHYGADRVVACDDATLADFRLEPYAALLSKLVAEHKPGIVIGGASTRGRELIAAAAADADSAFLADVTDIKAEGGNLIATRPVYSGKVISTVAAALNRAVFVTVRSRAFAAPEPNGARTGEVLNVAPALSEDQISMKIVGFEETKGTVNLSDAGIIVTGGRAVGSAEGFAPVRELADVLGGAVGATRAAVDAGYIPYAHQVGQTGKVVSPNLYIAAGVSGSIQHQAGMRTSKIIVAVNKDPDAPIFKIAQYGIVGDLFKVLPALSAAFREKLGK